MKKLPLFLLISLILAACSPIASEIPNLISPSATAEPTKTPEPSPTPDRRFETLLYPTLE